MTDSTINNPKNLLPATQSTTNVQKTSQDQATTAKKTAQVGQEEFLTLLVNQLQHQDPLDPLKSEEFAVQLAQFSQLEQLVQINKKLSEGEAGTAGISSMASFLGHEVVVKDKPLTISGGKGQNVLLNIPEGAQTARIDFVDQNGKVSGSKEVENLKAGQQVVELNGVNVPNGDYDIRAVAVNSSGGFSTLDPKITGTVEGFVLEPEPALLVNGEQVLLSEITEVYLGNTPGQG